MPAPLIGLLLQLSALALFVAMDVTIKLLTAGYPVPQIMFVRFAIHMLLVSLAIRLATGALPWRSRAPGLQALRSLCLAGTNLIFSFALARIPLADASAVSFASPIFTVALAAFWLGEGVGPRRWIGVAIGLAGVAVALRPPFLTGGEAAHWALALPLASALIFAVYQILTRRLAAVDDARTTILHTGIAAAIVTGLAQPFVWTWPSTADWALLIGLGVLGSAGHYLLVLAFARAPASLLAPMTYTQLIWATAASALIFGDVPDGWTLFGALVIAGGGLLAALPERAAEKERPGSAKA